MVTGSGWHSLIECKSGSQYQYQLVANFPSPVHTLSCDLCTTLSTVISNYSKALKCTVASTQCHAYIYQYTNAWYLLHSHFCCTWKLHWNTQENNQNEFTIIMYNKNPCMHICILCTHHTIHTLHNVQYTTHAHKIQIQIQVTYYLFMYHCKLASLRIS